VRVVSVATDEVVIGKVAELAAGATATLAGTLATGAFELDRATTAPEGGAGPESVTVPVEEPPPTTVEGAADREEGGGWSTKVAVRLSKEEAVTLWFAPPASDHDWNS
jgi:hypothetical protein